MFKRVIGLFVISLLIIGSSLVYNTSVSASPLGHAFKVPRNDTEVKIKNEIDSKIKAFRSKVNQDITDSFGLDLANYSEIDHKEILTGQHEELAEAFTEVLVTQKPGDVLPSVFVTKNDGYILEKKANGTSIVYTLKKAEPSWVIINKNTKVGKYIEPPQ